MSVKHEDGRSTKSSSDEDAAPLKVIVQSPGVQRIDAISSTIDTPLKIALFISIFFLSYAYGLDGSVRFTFQTTATNSYATHSLLATVAVVRSIIAAAAQPAYSRVADVFGRVELLVLSIVLYLIGTIIEASSHEVRSFSGGAILYQIGLTGIQLLVEVIIADVTTLRNRLFLSYIPATPFLINAWVSGNVTSSVLANSTWQWGVGMFAIIMPFVALPTIICLLIAERRAKRQGKLVGIATLRQEHGGYSALWLDLFWRLDVVGLILLCAILSLILVPLTIANSASSRWDHADVIAMLVIGVVTIPFFSLWELSVGGLGCAVFLNTVWYLQGDFLFTVLLVAFDQTVLSATRITTLYSFCSVLTGLVVGLIVRYVRYIKWFAVTGVCLFAIAMSMLVRYRGAAGSSDKSGIIGSQIMLGFAGGFTPYAVQALVQAATKHEHVALVTGLYLAAYYVGSGIGSSISGAIWTNTLPDRLDKYITNSTLALEAYSAPLTFILSHPVGTAERTAMVQAYGEVQRILCITGAALCVPFLICALALRNPRLGDKQSLDEAEGGATEVSPVEVVELEKGASRA